MIVTIEGRVQSVGPIQTFGTRGFQKRTVVVEMMEEHGTNLYAIDFTGDDATRVDEEHEGAKISVQARLNCRQYKKDGDTKWFVSLEMKSASMEEAEVASKTEDEEWPF